MNAGVQCTLTMREQTTNKKKGIALSLIKKRQSPFIAAPVN
jgi:hypothetical protein